VAQEPISTNRRLQNDRQHHDVHFPWRRCQLNGRETRRPLLPLPQLSPFDVAQEATTNRRRCLVDEERERTSRCVSAFIDQMDELGNARNQLRAVPQLSPVAHGQESSTNRRLQHDRHDAMLIFLCAAFDSMLILLCAAVESTSERA